MLVVAAGLRLRFLAVSLTDALGPRGCRARKCRETVIAFSSSLNKFTAKELSSKSIDKDFDNLQV